MKIILAFIMVFLAGYFIFNFNATLPCKTRLILSIPKLSDINNECDVLIYSLNKLNRFCSIGGEMYFKLFRLTSEKEYKKINYGKLLPIGKGVYKGKLGSLNPKFSYKLSVSLDINKNKTSFYLSNKINNLALIVIPPNTPCFAGENISISMLVLNKWDFSPVKQMPVRVKFFSDRGIKCIDRVIFSNGKGIAIFSTHLSDSIKEGIYKLIFETSNNKVIIKLPVYNSFKRYVYYYNIIKKFFARYFFPLELCNAFGSVVTTIDIENSALEVAKIFDIKMSVNSAVFSYHCIRSPVKRVEFWQNRNNIFTALLSLNAGTVMLPFRIKVIPQNLMHIRIWAEKQGKLYGVEYPVFSKSAYKNILQEQMNEINKFKLLFPEYKNIITKILACKATVLCGNMHLKKEVEFVKQCITIKYPFLSNSYENIQEQNSNKNKQAKSKRFFFIVDKPVKLTVKPNISLKLLTNKHEFYSEYLKFCHSRVENNDILLNKIIAAIELYKSCRNSYFNRERSNLFLQKIESYILPLISKISSFKHNAVSGNNLNLLNKFCFTVNELSKYVYVPKILSKLACKFNRIKISNKKIFLSDKLTLDQIGKIMRNGNSAKLMLSGENFNLVLDSNDNKLSFKSIIGKSKQVKIKRLCKLPVVCEIKYSW